MSDQTASTSTPPENLDHEPEGPGDGEPIRRLGEPSTVDETHVHTDAELVAAVGPETGHVYEPLEEGEEPGNELEVAVVANAIGWALYSGDGREVLDHDGVPTIEVSGIESAIAIAAASKAIGSLEVIRARVRDSERRSQRGRRGTATDRARRA